MGESGQPVVGVLGEGVGHVQCRDPVGNARRLRGLGCLSSGVSLIGPASWPGWMGTWLVSLSARVSAPHRRFVHEFECSASRGGFGFHRSGLVPGGCCGVGGARYPAVDSSRGRVLWLAM